MAAQGGAARTGAAAVKKFALAPEPAYYFAPKWSPDSKRIAFHDNRLNVYLLDIVTGKLSVINDKNVYGGFSDASYDLAWSPDSKWIAYPRSLENHLHALFLYSVDSGKSTQVTGLLADARLPAFDRAGKYLYYTASTDAGASSDGLDMSSDLYEVRSNIYAMVLSAEQASPLSPELDDEKAPGTKPAKPEGDAAGRGGEPDSVKRDGGEAAAAAPAAAVVPTKIDLTGIESRSVAVPLPTAAYTALAAGSHGSLYFLVRSDLGRYDDRAATLSRWMQEDRKTEKLAERIDHFELSADGRKCCLPSPTASPMCRPTRAGRTRTPRG